GGVGEGAVTLHDRLRLPRRAAGEQPDRRVVAVTGECLELWRHSGDRPRGGGLADDDDLFEVDRSRGACGLELKRRVAMHERHLRPRVRVEVLDRIGGKLWV